MLRKKAAEELKRVQEKRAEERRKIIRERTGEPKNTENANQGTHMVIIINYKHWLSLFSISAELTKIVKDYHAHIVKVEEEKYDLEIEVNKKEYEVKPQKYVIKCKLIC